MALSSIATAIRNAVADAYADAVDGGASNGIIELRTSGGTTLLVTNAFADPAYGAASTGVATANAIVDGTAVAAGTAAVCRICTTDDGSTSTGTLWEGTVTAVDGDGDVEITNTTIAIDDVISYTAAPITAPASG